MADILHVISAITSGSKMKEIVGELEKLETQLLYQPSEFHPNGQQLLLQSHLGRFMGLAEYKIGGMIQF